MAKRISFGIFLTNWIVGLFLVFWLSTNADADPTADAKSAFHTSQALFSESFNLQEIPFFEFDLESFVSGQGIKMFSTSRSAIGDIFYSEYTTAPFFDIKQTFIHFFYAW